MFRCFTVSTLNLGQNKTDFEHEIFDQWKDVTDFLCTKNL